MKFNASVIILYSLLLVACNSTDDSATGENNQTSKTTSENSSPRVTLEPEGIEKGIIKIFLKGEDGSEESSITYMFYSKDKLTKEYKKTVNELIHSNLYTNFEGNRKNAKSTLDKRDFQQALDKFSKDYYDLLDETEGETFSPMPWNLSQTFTIDTTLQSIVQLTCSYADYTGGAHGNYGTTHYVVDRTTGKQLTISDIVSNVRELNKLVEKYFRMSYKVPRGQRLDEFGLFENNIEANNNFYFDAEKKSLNFDYNPYEIGPYSMGMATVSIDLSALNSILKITFE